MKSNENRKKRNRHDKKGEQRNRKQTNNSENQ